jgi:uncharacterized membrane protein
MMRTTGFKNGPRGSAGIQGSEHRRLQRNPQKRGGMMRALQIIVFVLGVVVLVLSAAFVGTVMGDALWRAGVAAFLLDIVCIMLWPPSGVAGGGGIGVPH